MDKLNISRSGDKLTREDVIEKIKEYLKRLKNQNISRAAERRGRIGKSKGGFRKRI